MSTYLCDVNVWLALALSDHVHHDNARAWLDTIDDHEEVAFCRATQQALLRLLTSAAVLAPYGIPPLTNAKAWDAYEAFTDDIRVMLLPEPDGLEAHWARFATRNAASPKVWMDAYLAAFSVASGSMFVTGDTAFAQYSGLRLHLIGTD